MNANVLVKCLRKCATGSQMGIPEAKHVILKLFHGAAILHLPCHLRWISNFSTACLISYDNIQNLFKPASSSCQPHSKEIYGKRNSVGLVRKAYKENLDIHVLIDSQPLDTPVSWAKAFSVGDDTLINTH
jgi:hypothetical protein